MVLRFLFRKCRNFVFLMLFENIVTMQINAKRKYICPFPISDLTFLSNTAPIPSAPSVLLKINCSVSRSKTERNVSYLSYAYMILPCLMPIGFCHCKSIILTLYKYIACVQKNSDEILQQSHFGIWEVWVRRKIFRKDPNDAMLVPIDNDKCVQWAKKP